MARSSAGLLLFRRLSGTIEVLLVHPGGPFWVRKDDGAWSIPKGEIGSDEDPLEAARRETEEETGACPEGPFIALGPLRQSGGKLVHVWAVEADFDPARLESNHFELEWPPHSGIRRSFPEVDRAAWFTLSTAARKILKSQRPLLQNFQRQIGPNS